MRLCCSTAVRLCAGAVLLGAMAVGQAGAVLYKWVDAGGVTHYADRPEPGAQRVQIASAQSYHGAVARSGAEPRPAAAAKEPTHYTRLAIVSPGDGASVWNDGGRVAVVAALEPELAGGNQIWFVVDGTAQANPAVGLATSVELPRGSHTVSATVTDANGLELITSAPVSFSVHMTISPNAPRGPALPKPAAKMR